jgi:hypothetical protein
MSAPCPALGFVVHVTPRPGHEDEMNLLVADLEALLDTHGLTMSPSGHRGYALRREGSQATQMDRELVLAWAERWTRVADIRVSDITDLASD